LRHQLNVLQQRAPRRLHLRWADRALFIWLYRRCPRILDAVTIVRPETVVRCAVGAGSPVGAATAPASFAGSLVCASAPWLKTGPPTATPIAKHTRCQIIGAPHRPMEPAFSPASCPSG
jgi:hypothetical protein